MNRSCIMELVRHLNEGSVEMRGGVEIRVTFQLCLKVIVYKINYLG